MNLLSLKIENFRSFYGSHELDFRSFGPGLHFISGSNKQLERLEGNGVGKSSIFEALYWALFGKTMRGGVATNAITSWGRGATEVEVCLTARNGVEFSVVRKRGNGKNSLTLQGKEVVQEDIDMALGIDSSLFGPAFIRGQFSEMFFEKSPAEQLSLMTDILSLHFWQDNSVYCAGEAKRCKSDVDSMEGKISALVETIGERKIGLEESKYLQSDWESVKQKKVESLTQDLSSYEKVIRKCKKQISVEQELLDCFDEKLQSLKEKHVKLQEKEFDSQCRVKELNSKIYSMEEDLESLNEKLLSVSDLVGNDCPVCYQRIGEECFSSVQQYQKQQRDELENGLKRLNSQLKLAKRNMSKFENACEEIESKKFDVNGSIQSVKERMIPLERKLNNNKHGLISVRKELESQNSAENPHSVSIQKDEEWIQAAEKKLAKMSKDLDMHNRDLQMYKFWVEGFKEIRLMTIEECISALQFEVNNALSTLGMVGFDVEFACEKQNKSGSISSKFDIMVSSPNSKGHVPFTAWSGGEYQRLRLACELGISNLILGGRGLNAGWEVWDEPTSHMSRGGVLDLMSNLKARAVELNRAVFVIDHVAVDFPFDSVIQVVKEGNESRIVLD